MEIELDGLSEEWQRYSLLRDMKIVTVATRVASVCHGFAMGPDGPGLEKRAILDPCDRPESLPEGFDFALDPSTFKGADRLRPGDRVELTLCFNDRYLAIENVKILNHPLPFEPKRNAGCQPH